MLERRKRDKLKTIGLHFLKIAQSKTFSLRNDLTEITRMSDRIPALVQADKICIPALMPPFARINVFCKVNIATSESIRFSVLSSKTNGFWLFLALLKWTILIVMR